MIGVHDCSKRYQRPLTKYTETADDGYPQYPRRSTSDGGYQPTVIGGREEGLGSCNENFRPQCFSGNAESHVMQ